jgi:hypothetical protein
MSNRTQQKVAPNGDTITPWSSYPTIQMVGVASVFRQGLAGTGLAPVANALGRGMADDWTAEVTRLLDVLKLTSTAATMFSEIDQIGLSTGHKVSIWPRDYHPEQITPGGGPKQVIDMYLNAGQQGQNGLSGPAMMRDASKNIKGDGDNAIVYFDPYVWLDGNPVRQAAQASDPARYSGAGMQPEFVLFHELVHAMRGLKGLTDLTPTTTPDYVNLEEFSANLLTNVAMKEANASNVLRYGEVGFKPMPPQYTTSCGYLASNEHRDLISRIHRQDSRFIMNLALLTRPPWNPYRALLVTKC